MADDDDDVQPEFRRKDPDGSYNGDCGQGMIRVAVREAYIGTI
jgi:hypothetical protein